MLHPNMGWDAEGRIVRRRRSGERKNTTMVTPKVRWCWIKWFNPSAGLNSGDSISRRIICKSSIFSLLPTPIYFYKCIYEGSSVER